MIYDWLVLQYQDIAKNLTKGQFAQNLKSGSDIYEHVQFILIHFSSLFNLIIIKSKLKNTDVLMVIIYADVGFFKNFADNFTNIQELKKRFRYF